MKRVYHQITKARILREGARSQELEDRRKEQWQWQEEKFRVKSLELRVKRVYHPPNPPNKMADLRQDGGPAAKTLKHGKSRNEF